MPDILRYGLLCLIIAITNFQQGVTGFGSTALALPFVILLVGLDVAKPVLVMLAWVLNISIVLMARKRIVFREYGKIILLAVIGLPVGMWMAQALPEAILRVILAVFMLGIGAHGLITVGKSIGAKISPRAKLLVSAFLPLGGIVHGAFGSGGPLVVVYATRVIADKSVFRVTMSLVWLTLNTILISSWMRQGKIHPHELHMAALCLPFTLLGLYLGNHAHHRMNELAFKRMVYGVLCASGVALAWSVLGR